MASASSALCEEQFLCSICLNTFSEPVSTPCGHNYCKSCITAYWDSRGLVECPLCKKRYRSRPQLQVNTEFRDMVEHFSRMRLKSQHEIAARPGEVPCDVCTGLKLKAHKTCLVCLASYCQPHLEPHQNLKKHKLIDPIPNLEDRVCKKHDKMLELFCLTDEECVCLLCLNDDHAAHEAVPLERVYQERKAMFEKVTSVMKMVENTNLMSADAIKGSIQKSRKTREKDVAEIVQALGTLVASLQRKQGELIEVIEQKHKTFETQAEDHVKQLEQEVSDLKKRRSEIEQLLRTDDCLYFLQKSSSLHPPECSGEINPVPDPDVSQHIYLGMVEQSVAHIEKTLSDQMEMLINEVRDADNQSDAVGNLMTVGFTDQLLGTPQDDLMEIQQSNAVNVTLDRSTAHYKLVLSENDKKLTLYYNPISQYPYAGIFNRPFKYLPFTLAKEGFSSGKFYYEVRVSGSKSWILGVVKESINRELIYHPKSLDGAYTMCRKSFEPQLKTVGVFVDYEMGEVSFYDVEARTLIFSYTECTFTEPATGLNSFLYSMVGLSSVFRPKLYPVFGLPGHVLGENLVIVHSVKQSNFIYKALFMPGAAQSAIQI